MKRTVLTLSCILFVMMFSGCEKQSAGTNTIEGNMKGGSEPAVATRDMEEEADSVQDKWASVESVCIYSGNLDRPPGEEMEQITVTDAETIRKLVEYISDSSEIMEVDPDEQFEGINSVFVDFGNGTVVSMYDDLNYGNIGSEMVSYGKDVWLPERFHSLVISLLENQ